MTVFSGDFIVFHPPSRPEQVWVLTADFVHVYSTLDGHSATVSYTRFNTELIKRGYLKEGKANP